MSQSVLTTMTNEDLLQCLRKVGTPLIRELCGRGLMVRVARNDDGKPDFATAPKPKLVPGE